MKKTLNKIIGILLIIGAIGGFLFTTGMLISTWSIKPQVEESFLSGIELANDTLDATAQGLVLTKNALATAVSSISSVQKTVEATADTFDATTPMFDNLIQLSNDEFPKSISAAQSALDSAQQSAEIIDGVLSALTVFNRNLYNPDVPMHIALQQVSESMDSLPETFSTMETSLSDTKSNLDTIQSEIDNITSDIDSVKTSLAEFELVISQYQTLVANLQRKFTSLEDNIGVYLNFLAGAITVFLLWLLIVQLGLFMQGLGILQRNENQSGSADLSENAANQTDHPQVE